MFRNTTEVYALLITVRSHMDFFFFCCALNIMHTLTLCMLSRHLIITLSTYSFVLFRGVIGLLLSKPKCHGLLKYLRMIHKCTLASQSPLLHYAIKFVLKHLYLSIYIKSTHKVLTDSTSIDSGFSLMIINCNKSEKAWMTSHVSIIPRTASYKPDILIECMSNLWGWSLPLRA